MNLGNIFSNLAAKSTDSKRVVGIDIGSSSIKVVEVQDRSGVLTLTTYGELQLGPYADQAIGQSVTLEQKKEQQALVDVIRESAVKATNAVFAMPLALSFVTTINFKAEKKEDNSSASHLFVRSATASLTALQQTRKTPTRWRVCLFVVERTSSWE